MDQATFKRVLRAVRRVGDREMSQWLFNAYGVKSFAQVRPNERQTLLREMEGRFLSPSPVDPR